MLGFKRFILFCGLFVATLPLCAQNYGEINGTVTDPSGAVISGATVTVTNTATNIARTVQTNAAGNYTLPFLAPGLYDVRAEQAGFKAVTRSGVQLQVGSIARINVAMEVGAVTEEVAVTGAAPLLTTEGTAVGTVIENKRIVDLPLNGRNYLQLIALSPGVTAETPPSFTATGRQGGERAQQNYSIAGQRMQFTHYTLDGIENTDPNWNLWIFRPSIDALQEFKVETGVYSAEYGHEPSQVNVTTKSGTGTDFPRATVHLRRLGKKSVAQAVKEAEGKVGGPIKITGFVRFGLGEGIEKAGKRFCGGGRRGRRDETVSARRRKGARLAVKIIRATRRRVGDPSR